MTKLDLLSQFGTFSVGFDNVFEELNRAKHLNNPSYPPYNIVKIDDEHFVIELAIAGFGKKDISLELKENKLEVTGDKGSKEDIAYEHKGISTKDFVKTFILNADVIVKRADVVDGVLSIQLEKFIPEEKRPQKIELGKDISVKSFLAE